MLLEGSIQRFKLSHVLQLLAHTGATGVLEVRDFDEYGFIYLVNGRVEGISLPLTERKLGTRLLAAGYLTERQLAETLADEAAFTHDEKNGMPFGQRLITKGFTTEARIREIVRQQAADWLFELVQWQSGMFLYDEPEEMPDFRVQIQAELNDLLREANQRIAEGQRARKTENGLDSELCFVCPVASECSEEIKARYLKHDVCLWRSMSALEDKDRARARDLRELYRSEVKDARLALDSSLHW
jgi:hypothetical protein